MTRLFIGGVAHGRVLGFPEELTMVRVPVDADEPIRYIAPDHRKPVQINTQLYELRHYCFGPHERAVFVRTTLSNNEVISKYSKLIFRS